MHVREHAPLACALQDACGGADACVELLKGTPFATSRSRLYDARTENSGRTMTMGAVAYLERHANWRLYSFKVAHQARVIVPAVDASAEAGDAFERMARVHSLVRIADAGSAPWSENTRREVEAALQAVEAKIAGIRSLMNHGAVQAALATQAAAA